MKKFMALTGIAVAFTGCIKTDNTIEVKPLTVEVKPIELKITMDVKVDKALDSAFEAPVTDPKDEVLKFRAELQKGREVIQNHKKSGLIKENDKGYLEIIDYRKAESAAVAKIVESQNKARENIYKIIAKRDDTTVDFVGRRRAQMLAENELKKQQELKK